MVLKGHFDGRQIVLDEPVPKEVSPNTPVDVLIQPAGGGALADIAELARPGGLPPDFAEQHGYYIKGEPRR
ncbi:MAG: hypothetical protein HY718_13760 [Planctomycetes bacterium]|nr:hypothetical protein [Planctomycetota bacterium]